MSLSMLSVSMPRIRSGLLIVLMGLTLSGCGYNAIPTLEERS